MAGAPRVFWGLPTLPSNIPAGGVQKIELVSSVEAYSRIEP